MTEQDPDSLPYEKAAPNDYRWTSEAYEALVKGLMEASLTRQSDILTARVAVPSMPARGECLPGARCCHRRAIRGD